MAAAKGTSASSPIELLLHPVRLRIVHAMADGQPSSTAELCATLPEIPKTTVYRQVGLLADGGILDVVDERRVRGAVERFYRLSRASARIDARAGADMSIEDHRQAFAAAMLTLLGEFNAYLDRPGANPYADRVGYRQGVLWLDQAEHGALGAELRAVLARYLDNTPTAARTPYLTSLISFPNARVAETDSAQDQAPS
ncbi:ArsR family transcriptional regulator [Nocardia panacis]|uniref:ArsR family transcriptional regulator n=1 Tax=Nocardia panacis TaxID=2340916 RepID=A0A3A4KZF9_9NOCA|nr:helix-turn-helix domain-containing protein [Nocardia panacis]RJO79344.1 ArsR family transcriptional regulator [Nocardia panacis]